MIKSGGYHIVLGTKRF